MPTIDVAGDFTSGFTEFLMLLDRAESAAFYPGQVRISNIDSVTGGSLIFAADFDGAFNTGTGTGVIQQIDTNLAGIISGQITRPWDIEFAGLSINYASVFVVSGQTYTYSQAALLAGFSGQSYTVTGSGNDDSIGRSAFFAFAGDDQFDVGAGNDIVKAGGGNDQINGGAGRDRLFGDGGSDTILGGRGFDRLFGGKGADTLNGGKGNDILIGENGRDRLSGGDQNDTLTGGKGGDVFVFGSDTKWDTITDFGNGADKIQTLQASNFGDLILRAHKDGVRIIDGDHSLLLLGVAKGDLDAGDFLF